MKTSVDQDIPLKYVSYISVTILLPQNQDSLKFEWYTKCYHIEYRYSHPFSSNVWGGI